MVFATNHFKGEHMKHTKLMGLLKESGLKLHRSRLEFLSLMMIAIVQVKTVNLASLVGMMEGKARADSFYRRAPQYTTKKVLQVWNGLFSPLKTVLTSLERLPRTMFKAIYLVMLMQTKILFSGLCNK